MKLNVSKEWCMAAAKDEAGEEGAAGMARPLPPEGVRSISIDQFTFFWARDGRCWLTEADPGGVEHDLLLGGDATYVLLKFAQEVYRLRQDVNDLCDRP